MDIYIPFSGDFEYFQQAVDSVLAQNNPDWRLTVVDDRGTDATDAKDYLERLTAPEGQSIRYFRKKGGPSGQAEARNHCVKLAFIRDPLPDVGTYVTFLGDDDRLLPNFVDVSQEAHGDRPDASMVHAGVQNIDATGEVATGRDDRTKNQLTKVGVQSGEEAAKRLLLGNYVRFSAVSFKKEALRDASGWPRQSPDLRFGSDLVMILDQLANNQALYNLPEVAAQYRRHPESTTARITADGSRWETEREAFGLARGMMKERGWHRAAQAAGAHWTSRAHAGYRTGLMVASLGRTRAGTLRGNLTHIVTRALPMDQKYGSRLVKAAPVNDGHQRWLTNATPGYHAAAREEARRGGAALAPRRTGRRPGASS